MELHYAVGGMLYDLRFDMIRMDKRIEQLQTQVEHEVLHSLKDTSSQALGLLGETLHVVRQISENIPPSALPHLGLAEAIRNDLIKLEERHALKSLFTQWLQHVQIGR